MSSESEVPRPYDLPSIEAIVESDDDLFNRDQFGKDLTNFLLMHTAPMVAVLDEPWGTGKTVFARRTVNSLENRGDIRTIYIDAFEHDYEDDVFSLLVGNIVDVSETGSANKLKKAAGNIVKSGLRIGAKVAVRAATAGLVNAADFANIDNEDRTTQDALKDLENLTNKQLDQIIDERIKSASTKRMAFDAFRKRLTEVAGDGQILIVVDELDRCRPDYALEFVETIKHLFSVPHFNFLLITNMEALEASVRNRYGDAIDAHMYLQKFYDVRVQFPTMEQYEQERIARLFVKMHFASVENNEKNRDLIEKLSDFVKDRITIDSYSLRQAQKLISLMRVCISFVPDNRLKLAPIIAILVDMKISKPELYAKARNGTLKYEDLVRIYDFDPDVSPDKVGRSWFAMWWRYCLENPTGDEWGDLARSLFRFNFDDNHPERLIELAIRSVIEVFSPYSN